MIFMNRLGILVLCISLFNTSQTSFLKNLKIGIPYVIVISGFIDAVVCCRKVVSLGGNINRPQRKQSFDVCETNKTTLEEIDLLIKNMKICGFSASYAIFTAYFFIYKKQ